MTEHEKFEKVYTKMIGSIYQTPWRFERESWDEHRYKDNNVQFSWEVWQATVQQPIAQEPQANETKFNATRLRIVCNMLGLKSAVPESDEDLLGCMSSVLGMVRRAIEVLQSAKQPEAAPVVPEGWQEAAEGFRDTLLHQRGALAENGMTNDQVNDCLHEFDCFFADCFHPAAPPAPTQSGGK